MVKLPNRGGIEAKVRVVALLALLSLIFSIVVLVGSAVLLATGYNGPEVPWLSFLRVESLAWLVCCFAAVANLVWTATALLIRIGRYTLLSARETRRVDTDVEKICCPLLHKETRDVTR